MMYFIYPNVSKILSFYQVTNIKISNDIVYIFLFLEIQFLCYPYKTAQFSPAMFQVAQ